MLFSNSFSEGLKPLIQPSSCFLASIQQNKNKYKQPIPLFAVPHCLERRLLKMRASLESLRNYVKVGNNPADAARMVNNYLTETSKKLKNINNHILECQNIQQAFVNELFSVLDALKEQNLKRAAAHLANAEGHMQKMKRFFEGAAKEIKDIQ